MKIFEKYPKTRKPLPEDYQNIYANYYKHNREGETSASFFAQKAEAWLHKKVAKDVRNVDNKSTLEIGAGTLNQLKYEQTRPYDIVEPFTELFQNSKFLTRVNTIYTDVNEIGNDKKYDRITTIATFEHILNLPEVVAKTCLLLNQDGVLRVSIPNEGTFLWTLGWKFSTGLEFKLKYGLDYGVLMRYEHANTADEIEMVLKYFYKKTSCSVFGLSKKIALYRYYECKTPNVALANEYLTQLKNKNEKQNWAIFDYKTV